MNVAYLCCSICGLLLVTIVLNRVLRIQDSVDLRTLDVPGVLQIFSLESLNFCLVREIVRITHFYSDLLFQCWVLLNLYRLVRKGRLVKVRPKRLRSGRLINILGIVNLSRRAFLGGCTCLPTRRKELLGTIMVDYSILRRLLTKPLPKAVRD